jgi:hypothetical protein
MKNRCESKDCRWDEPDCGGNAERQLFCENGCCTRHLCVPCYKETRDYLARYDKETIMCMKEPLMGMPIE